MRTTRYVTRTPDRCWHPCAVYRKLVCSTRKSKVSSHTPSSKLADPKAREILQSTSVTNESNACEIARSKAWHMVITMQLQVLTWIVHAKSKEHGERYVLLYSGLCSLIASWTVLGCKAFMAFFRLTVEKGHNQVRGTMHGSAVAFCLFLAGILKLYQ
jgi:hypothetical protein